jgi:hypothetical protein
VSTRDAHLCTCTHRRGQHDPIYQWCQVASCACLRFTRKPPDFQAIREPRRHTVPERNRKGGPK